MVDVAVCISTCLVEVNITFSLSTTLLTVWASVLATFWPWGSTIRLWSPFLNSCGKRLRWWLCLPQWAHCLLCLQSFSMCPFCKHLKQEFFTLSFRACKVVNLVHSSDQWPWLQYIHLGCKGICLETIVVLWLLASKLPAVDLKLEVCPETPCVCLVLNFTGICDGRGSPPCHL